MDNINATAQPDVVVRGRHLDLGEYWVQHVREKTLPLARFGLEVTSFDVEVEHETNPRRASQSWHVEITAFTRKSPLRATGEGEKAEIAFERARETLEQQLRRSSKKSRWSRHGNGATARIARLLRG